MLKFTPSCITKGLLLISFACLFSCSDDSTEVQNGVDGTDGFNALVDVQDEPAGTNCLSGGVKISVGQDSNNNELLDESEIRSVSFICNGDAGVSDATLVARTSAENTGINCANGGTLIEIGTDVNGNNLLDDNEVQNSFFVCNGSNGDGNSSSGLTSLVIATPSTDCENGGVTLQIGLDSNSNNELDTDEVQSTYNICNGVSGTNSLIECTLERSGDNCENGGIRIEIGIDRNGNGELDAGEALGEPKYICNGLDGSDGKNSIVNINTDVPGCSNGGIELIFGYDNDGNGTVDEIIQTTQVCNGEDGSDGSDGSNGLNTIIETISDPGSCGNGGLEIRIGLDKNGDGDIDETAGIDNELISTEVVCNGEDGIDGTDGREVIMTSSAASCSGDGGRTYSFGYDNDGNGTIDDLLTSFTICNGTDGNSDGIYEFYFSNGFDGYNEAIDVSINQQGNDEYDESLSVDFADANMSNSILFFSKLQEAISSGVNGEPFEVVEAILYIRSAPPKDARLPPANENWIGVKTLTSNAPLIQDRAATYLAADGSDALWSSPGAAVTESGGANEFSDMFRLPALFHFDGFIPLLLNRSEITSWLQEEETNNKGMVLTMAGPTNYEIDFYSSEYETDTYLRPTLYIKVKTNTRRRTESISEKEYIKNWSELNYNEKLVPLLKRKFD